MTLLTVTVALSCLYYTLCQAGRPLDREKTPSPEYLPDFYHMEALVTIDPSASASNYGDDANQSENAPRNLEEEGEPPRQYNPNHVYGMYHCDTGEHIVTDHYAEGRDNLKFEMYSPRRYASDMAELARIHQANEYPEGNHYETDREYFKVMYDVHRQIAERDDVWRGCVFVPESRLVMYNRDISSEEVEARARNRQMPSLTYSEDGMPHCNIYTQ